MHESDAYYEEILYPLQNGVLSTLAACEAPFYLTGGTALHRHYFGFRYSDDLDLFVNQDPAFSGHVDRALAVLRARGYRFDADAFVRNDQYARVLIEHNDTTLKIDLVNDSAPTTVRSSRFRQPVSAYRLPAQHPVEQGHCDVPVGEQGHRRPLGNVHP